VPNIKPYLSENMARSIRRATGMDPEAGLRHLINSGVTIKEVAARAGVNRTQVYQAMSYFGIGRKPHDHTAYMHKWYAEQPGGAGAKLTQAAHAAVRGIKRTKVDLRRRAISKQRKPVTSKNEIAVARILADHGAEFTPQLAVKEFNIDLAMPSIMLAIEVNGGQWHSSGRKLAADAKKLKTLNALGWRVVYLQGSPQKIERLARILADEIKRHAGHLPPSLDRPLSRLHLKGLDARA
jgi:very-short-patch-repair endonuclease